MNHILLLRFLNLPLIAMLVVGLATIVLETIRTEKPNDFSAVVALPERSIVSHSEGHPGQAVRHDFSQEAKTEEDPLGVRAEPAVDTLPCEVESQLSTDSANVNDKPLSESPIDRSEASMNRMDADAVSGLVRGVTQVIRSLEESLENLKTSVRSVEYLWRRDRLHDWLTETLPTAVSKSSTPTGSFESAPIEITTVVLNPALNGYPVSFVVNRRVETLAPGQELRVQAPDNLKFDRGGEFGRCVESLVLGGRYEFHITDRGWILDQVETD